jgi:hypothetical protein
MIVVGVLWLRKGNPHPHLRSRDDCAQLLFLLIVFAIVCGWRGWA